MTIVDKLAAAHQRSVSLYLQRQQVERQRQDLASQAQDIDLELVRLDGEIRTLESLSAEANRAE